MVRHLSPAFAEALRRKYQRGDLPEHELGVAEALAPDPEELDELHGIDPFDDDLRLMDREARD